MNVDETSESAIGHTSCPECGSSDARALYPDGHSFCFSCNTRFPAKTEMETSIPVGKHTTDLIRDGEYAPLESRKLKVDTLRKYDYQLATWRGQGVQIANYRNSSGDRVAQHLRFKDKTFLWNGDSKHVQLFGQHLFGANGKQLIITEGEIDCMTIAQELGLTWATVSIPSGAAGAKKAIQRQLEYCESFEKVILAFDDDKAGREAIADVAPMFTPGKSKIMRYGGLKDANELFLTKGRKALVSEIFNADIYRPDGIINASSVKSQVQHPILPGLELPYPDLNAMLYGHRQGEITMLTAGSGLGKSTLAHEIGYKLLMEHGQTIGVMALEEPVRKAVERYASIHTSLPLHLTREEITDDELRKALDDVTDHNRLWVYDHFGSTAIDNLLSKVRFMVVGLGVQTIILDHISIVVSGLDEGIGQSERKMIDVLMTKLRSLVNSTNCSIIAVVHLKRSDSKGKSWNEGKPVALTDLRGSAALEQLSDNVVSVERNQQAEEDSNVATLRVLKCRHTGLTGKAGQIEYSLKTGRLLPYCPFTVESGEFGEGENNASTGDIGTGQNPSF